MNDRDILRQVGRNIQAARLAAGYTQECLAELVGVHWQKISGIETTFIRIAQHLRVSLDHFTEGLRPPDTRRARTILKALARKRRAQELPASSGEAST